MDFDLIGLSSLLLVTLLVHVIAKFRPPVATILYVALAVRILAIYLNNSVFVLPDGLGDTQRFELRAFEWSQDGFLSALDNYPGVSSFFISWVIAIFYSLFGQSELMAQSLSLFFGTVSVFLGWKLALKLWDQRVANKAGWVIALFPSLVLYSSLILREAYIYFFLLIALNGVVAWTRDKNIKSFILAFLGFVGAALFHDAMIIGLIVFIIIIFLQNIKNLFVNLLYLKIGLKSLKILSLVIIIISFTFINEITFPKTGSLTELNTKTDRILDQINNVNKGDAKYPSWLVPNTKNEIFYKSPFRMVYFVFSPFPWDIKKINHLVGMFDGILYMFLTYLIFRNRKIILSDRSLKIILLLLLAYILIYGIGVGNFGTGIRHRSKFAIIFILLAAPLLPKFIFSLNKKLKSKIK